jgi:hypothetical protein
MEFPGTGVTLPCQTVHELPTCVAKVHLGCVVVPVANLIFFSLPFYRDIARVGIGQNRLQIINWLGFEVKILPRIRLRGRLSYRVVLPKFEHRSSPTCSRWIVHQESWQPVLGAWA